MGSVDLIIIMSSLACSAWACGVGGWVFEILCTDLLRRAARTIQLDAVRVVQGVAHFVAYFIHQAFRDSKTPKVIYNLNKIHINQERGLLQQNLQDHTSICWKLNHIYLGYSISNDNFSNISRWPIRIYVYILIKFWDTNCMHN